MNILCLFAKFPQLQTDRGSEAVDNGDKEKTHWLEIIQLQATDKRAQYALIKPTWP